MSFFVQSSNKGWMKTQLQTSKEYASDCGFTEQSDESTGVQASAARYRSQIQYRVGGGFQPANFAFAVAMGSYDTAWDTDEMSRQMQAWGFPQTRFAHSLRHGINALLSWNDRYVYVHFRGTTDIRGAVLDGMFRLTEPAEALGLGGSGRLSDASDGQPRVHSGFHLGYSVLQQQLDSFITSEADPQSSKIFLYSGHSLGGALAQLSALHVLRSGRRVAGVYTTAAPRVGNEEFARRANVLLENGNFRLRLKGDVVPHVPPHGQALEQFARAWVVTDWPLVKGASSALVNQVGKGMQYTHAGEAFEFSAEDVGDPQQGSRPPGREKELGDVMQAAFVPLSASTSDGDDDAAYWSSRREKFTIREFLRHPPMHYLCQLAVLIP